MVHLYINFIASQSAGSQFFLKGSDECLAIVNAMVWPGPSGEEGGTRAVLLSWLKRVAS